MTADLDTLLTALYEATDLLALARLDGDGSPGRCGPPWSTLAALYRT